jgi:hypothetical protein
MSVDAIVNVGRVHKSLFVSLSFCYFCLASAFCLSKFHSHHDSLANTISIYGTTYVVCPSRSMCVLTYVPEEGSIYTMAVAKVLSLFCSLVIILFSSLSKLLVNLEKSHVLPLPVLNSTRPLIAAVCGTSHHGTFCQTKS